MPTRIIQFPSTSPLAAGVSNDGIANTSLSGAKRSSAELPESATGNFSCSAVKASSAGLAFQSIADTQISASAIRLASVSMGAITTFSLATSSGPVWPDPGMVLSGVEYGPSGNDYVGTATGSGSTLLRAR